MPQKPFGCYLGLFPQYPAQWGGQFSSFFFVLSHSLFVFFLCGMVFELRALSHSTSPFFVMVFF
jgi:hypothetical protein